MKPTIEVETIKLECSCGYKGVLGYEEMFRCPRCKEEFKAIIRITITSINIFREWVERVHTTAEKEYNTSLDRKLVEQQLRRIVDVEELMWNQPCSNWNMHKWETCIGATMKWIKRELIDKK